MGAGAGVGIEREELRALLELRALPGITDRVLGQLLVRYGTARRALRAPAAELGEKAAGVRGSRVVRGRVEAGLRTIEETGIAVLLESDPRYPARLRELHDPPPVLFARGRLELLDGLALAVVGARRPTSYGREAARVLTYGVARAGVVVVSGLARGIDGVAHEAALDAGGGTIGVLGCGIDVLYPREHGRLYERMASQGVLLSEFAPGEPPLQYHFPRRNRIIAALARGVLVVEASSRSGSLITVNHANDLGREVLSVPGPIGRETSAGTNELIRDGAVVVLGVDDILATLGITAAAEGAGARAGAEAGAEAHPEMAVPELPPPAGLEGEVLRLWRALDEEPRHASSLAVGCGLDPAATLVHLLELELGGHARQLAGLRFVRVGAEWWSGGRSAPATTARV